MRRVRQGSIDVRSSKQANLRFFNETLNRSMNTILSRDLEDLFTVDFRGHKMNALPFILNGACYFDNSSYLWLLKEVAREFPVDTDISVPEATKHKLIEAKVLDALLPGAQGRRELWSMYFTKNPKECSKLLYQIAIRTMNRVVLFEEYCHIRYSYKDICNTQAFSFYMTIYWLVNLTPVLRRQIEPNLKRSGFIEIFESLCPEASIHFKYISGEINADQLVRAYDTTTFEDGSTVAIREAYSNMSKGCYDGSPMTKEQWSIGREEADSRFNCSEEFLNMYIAHAYLYCGTYERLSHDLANARQAQKTSLEAEERAKQRYNKSADECRRLRKLNKELQEQANQLSLEIARHSTDDKLHKRIAELEKDLADSRRENDKLFAERLELKRELSSSAKQIKQLAARVPKQEDEVETPGVVTEDVPLEVMISALKDKRIVMVGGDRSKTLVKTFEDWGFRYFSNISGNVRRTECDFLVICSVLVSHGDVYQAEKVVRGQNTELVYVNGVNAELVLKALYEASEG